jgi:PII-like signaling protein
VLRVLQFRAVEGARVSTSRISREGEQVSTRVPSHVRVVDREQDVALLLDVLMHVAD